MERVIVKKEENEVVLNFDTKLYPHECIVRAGQYFTESCWVSLDGSPEELQIKLKPKSGELDLNVIGYEFYNHVLGIMKNEGRVHDIEKNFES